MLRPPERSAMEQADGRARGGIAVSGCCSERATYRSRTGRGGFCARQRRQPECARGQLRLSSAALLPALLSRVFRHASRVCRAVEGWRLSLDRVSKKYFAAITKTKTPSQSAIAFP